jgi:hypothetical protein
MRCNDIFNLCIDVIMAEIALLSGLNVLGKKAQTNKKMSSGNSYNDEVLLDDYEHSKYHTDIERGITKQVRDTYAKRHKASKDDSQFIIPTHYNLIKDKHAYGAQSNESFSSLHDTFESQFEPQRGSSKKNVSAINEGFSTKSATNAMGMKEGWSVFDEPTGCDMTLGVVDINSKDFTHNNMNPMTRMRDFPTGPLRDDRKLEFFTGEANKEFKIERTEQTPMFKQGKHSGIYKGSVVKEQEKRMVSNIGTKKNGDKPFEGAIIGPGLGLAHNGSLGGMHDTTRIMPKSIDETRRADNPKLVPEGRTQHGKKGSKRQVIGEKTRVKRETFRVNENPTVGEGGQQKAPKTRDNINIKIGNRVFSTPVVGPLSGSNAVYNPSLEGEARDFSRKTNHVYRVEGASGSSKKGGNNNVKSIRLNETQRTSTNAELKGHAGGQTRKGVQIDKDAVAKPTQQLAGYGTRGVVGTHSGGTGFNYNQEVIGVQQLAPYQTGMATRSGQGGTGFNYDQEVIGVQQLTPYQTGMATRSGQGGTGFNYDQEVIGVQQLAPYQTGMATRSGQGGTGFNYDQEVIGVQQLEPFQMGGAGRSGQGGTGFNYDQEVIGTQQLAPYQMGGAGRSGQGGIVYDHNEQAKPTMKQTTVGIQRNNNMSTQQRKHMAHYQDEAKTTIKQGTVVQPNNTFVHGNATHISQLQDDMKYTQQHALVQNPAMGGVGVHMDRGYTNVDYNVPLTMAQLSLAENYVNPAGNSSMLMNNAGDATNWYAPTTLKQGVITENYTGIGGMSMGTLDQEQYHNAHVNTFKEQTTMGRAPTTSNVSLIPTSDGMGDVSMKQYHNTSRMGISNQGRIATERTNPAQTFRNAPSHGHNIMTNYKTLDGNQYTNKSFAHMYQQNNMNVPGVMNGYTTGY